MQKHRIEKVLVVNADFKLKGMITVKDFQKAERKPNACKDDKGRLRVGAAVGAGAGNEERVAALVEAGVDVLLIDSSHGHSQGVLDRIKATREAYLICRSSAATSPPPPVPRRWPLPASTPSRWVSARAPSVLPVS